MQLYIMYLHPNKHMEEIGQGLWLFGNQTHFSSDKSGIIAVGYIVFSPVYLRSILMKDLDWTGDSSHQCIGTSTSPMKIQCILNVMRKPDNL